MVRLSLVNMYLHGFANPKIHEYDTLTYEDRWQDTFDVIMANPPFMSPKGGIKPHNRFSIQAKRSEVLFVDYIAEHLNPSGRAGIVVPEGIVNTKQNAYNKLRRMLVRDSLIGVISLPRGVFNPYSNVKTYILLLDKLFFKKAKDVLFLRIENDGFDLGVQRKPQDGNDIPSIIHEFTNYKMSIEKGMPFVPAINSTITLSRELILSAVSADLFAERYIDNQKFINTPNCKWVKLKDILTETNARVKERKDVTVMSITMKNGLIEQARKFKKDIASKNLSSYKLVKKGQLVIGFPINEGVLAILKSHEFGAVSPAYSVWDIEYSGLNFDYFDLIIKSPKMIEEYERLMTGTTGRRKNISKESFLDLMIPIPLATIQESIVKEMEKIIKLKNDIIEAERILVGKLNDIWDNQANSIPPPAAPNSAGDCRSNRGRAENRQRQQKAGRNL